MSATTGKPLARLAVPAAFPWTTMLRYLHPRLITAFERVDETGYERRVGDATLRASLSGDGRHLELRARGSLDADDAQRRVAGLFALQEDPRPAQAHLAACPALAPRIARLPGLRPLGSWDAFELCVRTVLGQQVTVAAAGTLMQRLIDRAGIVTPQAVLAADLSAMGMPGRRVQTLRALAQAIVEDRVSLDAPWAELDAALLTLPGFGPWTRSYLAIRLGREPDAFPESDVGLMRAAGIDTPKALLARAEAWRPYRSLAATHLWVGAI